MSEFGSGERNEQQRKYDAAVALVRRVNEIVRSHDRTATISVFELQRDKEPAGLQEQDELIRMSARNHLQSLAAFYRRLYPASANAVRLEGGEHSALPLRDVISGNNFMLLTTTLTLDEGHQLDLVSVSMRDEFVIKNSSVLMHDDARFETVGMVKARDDGLIDEALGLVEVGKREVLLPLLSGTTNPKDAPDRLAELREIVAERYDADATERFMQAIEKRYHDKRETANMAKELGLIEMSASEIEDVLNDLDSMEDYR